jgi:hypothetical protein
VDRQGLPFLGMTGKFHFSWGEVGGYKKPDALLYECAAMIAQGARCSIGDHLHPTASIDESTMAVIGPAYKWVAEREMWVEDSVNGAQIALLSQEAVERPGLAGRPNHHVVADEGAVRVLMEGQFLFDVVDKESDFAPYRLLILPDRIEIDGELKAKIEAYVSSGGRLLLTGASGIDPQQGLQFDVGGTWHGTAPMNGGDYLLPVQQLRAEGINDPLFMYHPSEQVTVADGQTLGEVYAPYMDRQPRNFSGHVNAPSMPDPTPYVAGLTKGSVTYFAYPIFSVYHHVGAVSILEIAENLVEFALGEARLLTTTLPRAGRVTVRRQLQHRRDIVHLLHATPAQRGNLGGSAIQPIQDLVAIANTTVQLRADSEVRDVQLVPELHSLPFTQEGDAINFSVPVIRGHQMIEVSYATTLR